MADVQNVAQDATNVIHIVYCVHCKRPIKPKQPRKLLGDVAGAGAPIHLHCLRKSQQPKV